MSNPKIERIMFARVPCKTVETEHGRYIHVQDLVHALETVRNADGLLGSTVGAIRGISEALEVIFGYATEEEIDARWEVNFDDDEIDC